MEKLPEPFQSLPRVARPVHGRTGQTCSLTTHLWPNSHGVVHILPNSSNPAEQTAVVLWVPLPMQISPVWDRISRDISTGTFLPGCLTIETLSPTKAWQVVAVSAFWGARATGISRGAVFPTSWQFADTRGHLPLHHATQTEVIQLSHQLWNFNGPSFHTFLGNLSKHSAPNCCGVWGIFLSSRWQKGPSPFWLSPLSQQKLLCNLQSSASHRSPCTCLVLTTTYCRSPSRETPSTRWQRNTDVEKIKTRYTVTHD